MKFLALALTLLLGTTQRLPAPVQETSETPTPAAVEPAKKSGKVQSKSKMVHSQAEANLTPKPNATPLRSKFAGTWKGTLNGAANGAVVTIIISPAEDSAIVRGLPMWGDRRGRATAQGNTMSWPFMAESWTMTVSPDGKTATVTGHHWPSGTSTGTVERMQ